MFQKIEFFIIFVFFVLSDCFKEWWEESKVKKLNIIKYIYIGF